MTVKRIAALLRPSSLALVGASDTPGTLGNVVCRNLADSGFEGQVYFVNPAGQSTYFNLEHNFRACVATEIALIALYNETLALYLLVVSYILIGFLFALHKDAKA